jgi:hypothetical protein
MTFFKTLMRTFAAAGATALLMLIPKLIAVFQGSPPSDISPVVWGIVGTVAVFVLNLVLGEIPHPSPPVE